MNAQRKIEPSSDVTFDTHPGVYRHWKLTFDGPIATLTMDVDENGGLRPGYALKLNSYDLGDRLPANMHSRIVMREAQKSSFRTSLPCGISFTIFVAQIAGERSSGHRW